MKFEQGQRVSAGLFRVRHDSCYDRGMEPRIRERINEAIVAEALRRYGAQPGQAHALDGFESFIYEVEVGHERPFILRLSHSLRRTKELIRGEVDWINHLAARSVGVARALPSASGELVEQVADGQGGDFLATAFAKAPGALAWHRQPWDAPFIAAYGRLLGQMHAATIDYAPGDPAWRRPSWDDPDNLFGLAWIPEEQKAVRERYLAIISHLQGLPRDATSYGLIHQDAHPANMFATEDLQLTLFDFDDCVYSWFIYDVAMVLFYVLVNREDAETFGRDFWATFWPAYKEVFDLGDVWLAEIPSFLKFREVDLYGAIYRSMGEDWEDDPWVRAFMDGRRERIENGTPFVDLDFARL